MATVLVVDDHQDGADMLAALVERCGHQAIVAYNGRDALRLIQERCPDTVLLDIVMPGLSGFEVANRVREWDPCKPRLIGISGMLVSRDEAARHFDKFVPKPFGIDVLKTLIEC